MEVKFGTEKWTEGSLSMPYFTHWCNNKGIGPEKLKILLKFRYTQPFYGSVEFVGENPDEPVPEETFTHYSHRSHQSSLSAFSI